MGVISSFKGALPCFNREAGGGHLLEAIVEDFWNDAGHERTADLQAGVRIHFDEVETEVFIDHEVVPEELWRQKQAQL